MRIKDIHRKHNAYKTDDCHDERPQRMTFSPRFVIQRLLVFNALAQVFNSLYVDSPNGFNRFFYTALPGFAAFCFDRIFGLCGFDRVITIRCCTRSGFNGLNFWFIS